MSEKTVIPVAFAINDNYVLYWGVAASSLIEHASSEYMYKVYVFYTELSEYNIRRVEGMSTANVEIRCMNISNDIPKVELKNRNHLTIESLYRIVTPLLLKEYEKILYLDSDIVILRDLAELYHIDIGDYSIGAIEEKQTYALVEYLSERNMTLEGYFNAGVLVLNTKKLLERDILGEAIKILDTDVRYDYLDQDALNIILNGDIYYLPDQWNVEWHTLHNIERVIEKQVDAVMESVMNPYVVHYTTRNKAWHRPDLELADKFWECARKTPFYEEIIYKNMSNPILTTANDPFERFIFPWDIINNDSQIIIYGAGVVGRTYLEQIEQTGYCTVLAIADKKIDKIKVSNAIVVLPDEIKTFHYDKILVAIESGIVAKKIICELANMGYDESRIVWKSPLRKR